jgi:hypothetical protein
MSKIRLLVPLAMSWLVVACSSDEGTVDAGLRDAGAPADAGDRPDAADRADAGSPAWTVEIDVAPDAAAGDRRLITGGQIFSGAVWFPLDRWAEAELLEPHIVTPGHRLGALRYSLQELSMAPGQMESDLAGKLASFPDAGFLRRYRDAGGEVILNIDRMPQWLADEAGPTGICGADHTSRPPTDYARWRTAVVEPIVAYFAREVGPGLRYSLWNEPGACTWLGTTDEFLELYAATAAGILAVDPTAEVGAPELERIGTTRTINDPAGVEEPFLLRLIRFAGERSLPLDFLTYHSYDNDPTRRGTLIDAGIVGLLRGWLDASGFSGASTEIMNTEWHYRVYEDKYTNNTNTSHVAAAYVGSAMVAFHAAGLDNHATQAWLDYGSNPGPTNVISPTMNEVGLPRASYNVFEMLNLLTGEERATSSEDPWAQHVAFVDGDETRIFIAHFVPTDAMSVESAGAALYRADPVLVAKLATDSALARAFADYVSAPAGSPLPAALEAGLSAAEQETLRGVKRSIDEDRARRELLGVGPLPDDAMGGPFRPLAMRVLVEGIAELPTRVLHAHIDSGNVVDGDKVAELGAILAAHSPGSAAYAEAHAEIWRRDDVTLQWDDLTSSAAVVEGGLAIEIGAEPFSVHLIRVQR